MEHISRLHLLQCLKVDLIFFLETKLIPDVVFFNYRIKNERENKNCNCWQTVVLKDTLKNEALRVYLWCLMPFSHLWFILFLTTIIMSSTVLVYSLCASSVTNRRIFLLFQVYMKTANDMYSPDFFVILLISATPIFLESLLSI